MLGLSPSVAVSTSGRSMALEVLPALMYIAAPALRPVSQHLYHPAELEVVRCVCVLAMCGLASWLVRSVPLVSSWNCAPS